MTAALPHPVTIYDSALFEDNFPVGVEDHFWFRARNAILDKTLRRLSRDGVLSPRPAILEVGCGTGIVVEGLRHREHDIRGVELGQPPRTLVPDRISTGIKAQDLDPKQREPIEALMFLDVIEHVPDDVALLRDTIVAFPNCRCVLITVPARQELWSRHDDYYKHYRRYSRRMLRDTLQAAGLQPARTRYMFRGLYAAAAFLKASGRDRDPIMHAPRARWAHEGMAAAMVMEDRLLAATALPGLSVLGVGVVNGR